VRAFLALMATVLSSKFHKLLKANMWAKTSIALVSEFGPPASTFKMNSGETAYTWQLSSVTDIDTYRGSGTASTFFCKLNVISSPKGIVTKLTTEDVSGTRGILGDTGVDFYGSLCARRLGIQRPTPQ